MEFYTCIAKYAFFGIRDEKLLATARKSWYHTMVCSGIEVVITGLTRNFWKLRPFCPLKRTAAQGFAQVRISQFHIVLACFSCIFSAHGKQLRYTEGYRRGHNENDSKSCFHFGSPNCRKASNHAGLRASSNCELGSVLSCCSSQFPRLEFCGKMAIMRAAI